MRRKAVVTLGVFGLLCLLCSQVSASITSVERLGTSGNTPPELAADPLGEDSLAFTDRTHQWNEIPEGLRGAQYVMVANNDRDVADYGLKLVLDAPGTIAIMIDCRVNIGANMPWVLDEGWVETGALIGVDEGGNGDVNQRSRVFVKDFDAGEVILKAQNQGGTNNYGVALTTGPVKPNYANMNGWIMGHAWNFLLLNNPLGCGPGGALDANWVAPHDIVAENPKAGTEWADIDFGGASPSDGWRFGDLSENPVWASYSLLISLNPGAPYPPRGDLADWNAIVDWINNNVLQPNGLPTQSNDNIVAVATTYVENTTGAPLVLNVCHGSDDSGQVWVNNVRVLSVNACRGSGVCQELVPAVFPPGISQLRVQAWEGGGGWNTRIRLQDPETGAPITYMDDRIKFLGPGIGDDSIVSQIQLNVVRTVSVPDTCANTAQMCITAAEGTPPDNVTLIQEIRSTNARSTEFPAEISCEDATVEDILGPTLVPASGISVSIDPDGDTCEGGVINEAGFVQSLLMLGPMDNPGGAAPGDAELQAVQIQSTSDPNIDESNPDYRPKAGDTVPDNVRGIVTNNCNNCDTINPGGVLTWNEWTGDANFNFNDYYGGDVNNCIVAVAFYLCVQEEKTVYFGVASDDSFTVRVDGQVVGYRSVPRGYGGANTVQDFVGPVTLSPGKHFVLYKVYEGGGGHGGRIGIFEEGVVGKRITINTTAAALKDGVCCDITLPGGGSLSFPNGEVLDGDQLVALITGDGSANLVDPTEPAAGWLASDIGAVGIPGSEDLSDIDNGNAVVLGSGADIWGGSDQFHFVWKEIAAENFVIQAAVTEFPTAGSDCVNDWAKAGVMFRDNCLANSAYSFAMLRTGPNCAQPGYDHQARAQGGAGAFQAGGLREPVQLPFYLRLVKQGDQVTAFVSQDGSQWQAHGSVTLPDEDGKGTFLAGLAVTSHDNGALTGAAFGSILMGEIPPCVTDFAATTDGTTVELSWTNNGTYTKFALERRSIVSTQWETVADNIPGDATSYSDTPGKMTEPALVYRLTAYAVNESLVVCRVTTNVMNPDYLVYQDGVFPTPDYAGTADAHVLVFRTDNNTGGHDYIEEGDWNGGHGDHKEIFVRFDLTGFPEDKMAESASLHLFYALQRRGGAFQPVDHDAYVRAVLKAWGEGTGTGPDGADAQDGDVTWNSARHNQEAWEVPGAYGETDIAVPDPADDVKSTVPYGSNPGQWVHFEGNALTQWVNDWLLGRAPNNGLKVTQNPGHDPAFDYVAGAYDFASSDNADPTIRPVLVIKLTERVVGVPLHIGDTNGDGKIDIADPICTLGYLFGAPDDPCKTPPCLAQMDANGDGGVDIADPIAELGFLFAGQSLTAPDGTLIAPTQDGCFLYPEDKVTLPCDTPCTPE